MIYKKITYGFVVQTFDTELGRFVSQDFIAGDLSEYENEDGEVMDSDSLMELGDQGFGPESEVEPYLPFEMIQPDYSSTECVAF